MRIIAGGFGLLGLVVAAAAALDDPKARGDDQTPPGSDEVVLSFKGEFDGSEEIKITQNRAAWRHTYGNLPTGPVTLNGISWNTADDPSLKNEGSTRFLPKPVDFQSARLRKIEGRDTVVLERFKDSVVVHISDTPNFAAPYEFQVIFPPRSDRSVKTRAPARSNRASLRIVAEIDGSDELHINADGARWVHRQWEWPGPVRLNDVEWDPEESPTLKNAGDTKFLDSSVVFSTARMVRNAGRDLVVMEPTDGGLIVYFADNPLSRATYDVTIKFGE
jgi:hypothetical protein